MKYKNNKVLQTASEKRVGNIIQSCCDFFQCSNIRFDGNRLDEEDLHSDLNTVFKTSEL